MGGIGEMGRMGGASGIDRLGGGRVLLARTDTSINLATDRNARNERRIAMASVDSVDTTGHATLGSVVGGRGGGANAAPKSIQPPGDGCSVAGGVRQSDTFFIVRWINSAIDAFANLGAKVLTGQSSE